jgi:hypothetical protein
MSLEAKERAWRKAKKGRVDPEVSYHPVVVCGASSEDQFFALLSLAKDKYQLRSPFESKNAWSDLNAVIKIPNSQ